MTELMISLRRSPRTLLARDGHPGPGPGRLALVMARAGVGKTAFLTAIGVDALLAGQRVLHVSIERTIDKVREWYDESLVEMLRIHKKLEHLSALQLVMERNRHIHTFVGQSFSVDRVRQTVALLRDAMEFVPGVIILDRMEYTELDVPAITELKALAGEIGAELWMACRTHRHEPPAPGHLPPPADTFEDEVDLAFGLVPSDAKIRLHVLKDRQQMVAKDLNIVLDPQSMLLVAGIAAKK
ncbi:MAG TPA: hypothetical protein VLT32_08985 [Candidatus Sulfomarinibacteraceae bacterium]|nr:hypothetical protein [Candidatus Sulfomarinibacteraceae bacterium]